MKSKLFVENIAGKEIDFEFWRKEKLKSKIAVDSVKLKKLFENVLPHFGLNHAKAFRALLSSDSLNASELIDLTEIRRGKIYSVLNDLIDFGFVNSNHCSPAEYFAKRSSNAVNKIFSHKIREMGEMQNECLSAIRNFEENVSPAFVLDVARKKIYNRNSKTTPLQTELREMKKVIELAIAKTVPKTIPQKYF